MNNIVDNKKYAIEQKCCRICGNTDLIEIVNLGVHTLCGRFPAKNEPAPISAPLVLVKCNDIGDKKNKCCGLVQLRDTVNSDELYFHNYGYRSGLNNSMISHLSSLVGEICNRISIQQNDVILDIGSNDCTLLKAYSYDPSVVTFVGIDPIGKQFKQFYPEYISLINEFFTYDNYRMNFGDRHAKIITSIAMFYDLPSPIKFMQDIKKTLHRDGIWITEQSYIVSMMKTHSFDTICHEHLEYYSFKQFEWMANVVGLRIIDVTMNDCNGGSFRLTLTHKDNSYVANEININKIREYEEQYKLDTVVPYERFNDDCIKFKETTTFMLNTYVENNKKIYLYGASTKGNTLLQYLNVDKKIIVAAADRNTEKFGRRTPRTDIPIISETEMRNAKPDVLLVLPWHFKKEFITRESEYIANGGIMIFPLPQLEIISKKRALIIGYTGQIGQYLANELLEKNYLVYGVSRGIKINSNNNVIHITADVTDSNKMKLIIETILPDEIYNLASPTTIVETIENPISAYQTNIMALTNLCEITRKINPTIKIFNAGSSEMYRENVMSENTLITYDEMTQANPYITPYSISKASAYQIIKYYREILGLPYCTGILCNVISPKLDRKYFVQKIIYHVKYSPYDLLTVGNIDIGKDFIHAHDAAKAIMIIMTSSNDCVVSSASSEQLKRIIEYIYLEKNINIKWTEMNGYDSATDKLLIHIDASMKRKYEKNGEKIIGNNKKLLSLGWMPEYDIKSILHEMCLLCK